MKTTTAKTKKTTVDLDAETVAKFRASLRAIGYGMKPEDFLGHTIWGLLEGDAGFFEGLIPRRHEHRRAEIKAKLERIRQGDRRLVRPEPMPRNAVVYERNIGRLKALVKGSDSTLNSALNALLEYGLDHFEAGRVIAKEDQPEVAA